jgi:uncharacterized protein DUF935
VTVLAAVTAPTTEIGYTLAPTYNRVPFDDFETTPELVWPQSIYVYDQMRRTDSQVGSVLRAVTETLLRTPWRIDPAGARARVTKFVADDLGLPIVGKNPTPPPRLKDRFSWPSHLREALLMLPMGHAYFEQVYRINEAGTAAHLRKLAYRPAKTLEEVNVAPDGGLISIKQYWTRLDREPEPIPVNHLVAYIHAKEGGNWLGTSILRNCYKNWLLKDRLLRVQAQTIERNGMGVPLYKDGPDGSTESMAKGLAMATSWRAGEAAGSAVPHEADLVLRGVEGTLPDAMPAIEYHDSQIARAVLAHFLNLGQQTGSWALGTTFADFFTMSLQTLAEQIRDTATQHIVEDLVDINFGEDEPAPRLVFDEIGSRQAATAQAIKTLVDAGVIHPDQVLEESSRQQYGLPPADPATATPPPGPLGPTPPAPTQMGDTSPSVSASADPKGQGTEAEERYDSEADDWEDAIDALILALDELTSERVEAAFNPKQARNPKGSPGGGRFRSMVDRLKDAIDEHSKGGGKGHPFAEFDREQLRRVARARGIELKRGEDRDSIAGKLLGHLGYKPAPRQPVKKALRKAVPKRPAPTGVEAAREHARRISGTVAQANRDQVSRELERQAALTPKSLQRLEAVHLPEPGSAEATEYRDGPLGRVAAYYTPFGQSPEKFWESPKLPKNAKRHPALWLNPDWHDDHGGGRMSHTHNGSAASGWFAPTEAGTPLAAIVAHEYGHHVSDMFFPKLDTNKSTDMPGHLAERLLPAINEALGANRYGRSAEDGGDSWDTLDPGGDLLAPHEVGPVGKREYVLPGSVSSTWMTNNRALITEKVSEYGSTSVHEMLAEIWAEYSTKGTDARPWIKVIGALMQEIAEEAYG